MKMTKRDASQISKFEHDEASNAKRVKMVETEMSIELNHEDGDSVTSHPHKLSITATEVINTDTEIIPPIDCSSLKEVRVDIDGSGNADVYASPSDTGDFFYYVGSDSTVLNICARRLKVMSNGSFPAVGTVHLVGRS